MKFKFFQRSFRILLYLTWLDRVTTKINVITTQFIRCKKIKERERKRETIIQCQNNRYFYLTYSIVFFYKLNTNLDLNKNWLYGLFILLKPNLSNSIVIEKSFVRELLILRKILTILSSDSKKKGKHSAISYKVFYFSSFAVVSPAIIDYNKLTVFINHKFN